MQWCLVQSILVRLSSSVTPLPITISTEGNMKKESRGKDHKKKGTIRKARKVGGPGPTEPQAWGAQGPAPGWSGSALPAGRTLRDSCLSSQGSIPRIVPSHCVLVDSDSFKCIL